MDERFLAIWFQGFTEGIQQLDEEARAVIFGCCAKRCADSFPVALYQRAYEQVGGSLSSFFRALDDGYNIETSEVMRDRVYRLQYTRCGCDLHMNKLMHSAELCKCSRLSLLYCLKKVMPERDFTVEAEKTILSGGDKCSFQITVL